MKTLYQLMEEYRDFEDILPGQPIIIDYHQIKKNKINLDKHAKEAGYNYVANIRFGLVYFYPIKKEV